MTARGFLRVFGVCIVVIWALLITVLLAARTVVAVEKAVESWQVLNYESSSDTAVTDTSMTTGDTAMTDTMATDTMATGY